MIGWAAHAAEPLNLRLATSLSLPRLPVYEALIVEVRVNRQKRGEFTVYRDRDGEYYVKPADLRALGIDAPHRSVLLDGEAHVPLKQFAPQKLVFDEARLVLEVEFPPPALRRSTYDLSLRRPNPPQHPPVPGAFVNYRLSASDASSAPPKLGLASELAARIEGVLLRHESAVIRSEGSTRGVRYATQLVHDRPAEQLRVLAGDHTAASGELGSTVPVGGLSVAKLYQLTPHFVRQPLAGYAGAVSTPSQVEVRMGGVPVFREQVPAGPFELRNLQQYAGARDVEIFVRDALGREHIVGFPYYFADQALREGLHEYSYSAGTAREELGARSNQYGQGIVSGVHRYGLSDRLTLGARGEAASGRANFGPTALYRDDRLGAFSAGVSGSRDGGTAASFGHVYQAQRYGLRASWRRYSNDYTMIQPVGLRAEYGVGGSLMLGAFGTMFLDRTVSETHFSTLGQTRLGYTYNWGREASLFATAARIHDQRVETQLFLGVLIALDREKTAHLSARRQQGDVIYGAQLSSAVPAGEGLGYRFGYEDTGEVIGYAQYNARASSLSFDGYSREREERYEVAVAGAATWTGGRFGLARQIDDSFVAVELAAPLEGVRVYSNNREVGRTDSEGRLIVPNVGSFHETQIAIEETDVPLDHAIGALRRVVAPAYRSGTLLRFDVRRVRAAEGTLLVGGRPAEHALVQIADQEVMTGRDGRYYIEDLAPGRHAARVGECTFFLDVPEVEEPVVALPEVACE